MTIILEERVELSCEYDADDDTLYAWIGEQPTKAITYETDEGHLVRLDPDTNELVGITIFDFEARWANEPMTIHWQVEVEHPASTWLPFSRKRRALVPHERVLHRVSNATA